jgi:hypothetical protein
MIVRWPAVLTNARQWAAQKLRQFWPVVPLLAILCALMLADFNDFMGYSPFANDSCGLEEIDQSGFSASLYNRLASRVLHPRPFSNDPNSPYPNVSIVTIDANSAPPGLLNNACDERTFIARLTGDLNLLGAAFVVVDKYYSPAYCGDSSMSGQFIQRIGASKIPVVIGRPTHALPASAQSGGCLALSPRLIFPATAKVFHGLTRLNSDTLKIPLHWPVFKDTSSALPVPIEPAIGLPAPPSTPPQPAKDPAGNGLALVAAETYNPAIANSPRLKKLLSDQVHPYTTFLNLPNINAMAVLCNAEPAQKYSIDPGAPAPQPVAAQPAATQPPAPDPCDPWVIFDAGQLASLKQNLAGKIVVIGDLSEEDMQPFPGGDKPGVFLQANYIQSILDQRFLVEIPLWLTLGCLLLFVIAVYCLYWSHDVHEEPHLTPEQAGVASTFLLLILAAISFGALHFLYYTPVWALWGAGVFVLFRYLEASGHHRSQHLLAHLSGQHPQPAVNPHPAQPAVSNEPPPPPANQP